MIPTASGIVVSECRRHRTLSIAPDNGGVSLASRSRRLVWSVTTCCLCEIAYASYWSSVPTEGARSSGGRFRLRDGDDDDGMRLHGDPAGAARNAATSGVSLSREVLTDPAHTIKSVASCVYANVYMF